MNKHEIEVLEDLGFHKYITHLYNRTTQKQTTQTRYSKYYNSSKGASGGYIEVSQDYRVHIYHVEGNCEALRDLDKLKSEGIIK